MVPETFRNLYRLAFLAGPRRCPQIGPTAAEKSWDCCNECHSHRPRVEDRAGRRVCDDDATPSTTTGPVSSKRLGPRHVLWAAGVLLCVALGAWGVRYWTVGRFIESTDDAYVKADSTTVAPKVSGYIAQVLVDDNQPVKAGQVLARIDDRDLQTALREANANLARSHRGGRQPRRAADRTGLRHS